MKNLTLLALFMLTLVSCKETEKKTELKQEIVKEQKIENSLTKEEKIYIINRFNEFKEIKLELNNTNKNSIGKLNKKINDLENFPNWFSKNTQEIRHLRLLKTFLNDLGNGIAINNKQLIEIAKNDFDKYSSELENLLNNN
ncbi:hypothetical protein [Algibacter lectus]|uniref:Lipoprotein n=1 Tax=Algibacter lectus TaxID=221126 RepID=A0A4R8MFX7_9FLAO|nr:hypothetical protein [Algibacter lectus]MWW24760.1 hypothetical protein [Algibacter lectus]TDY64829.1 hypothetical protein DFQ06_1752 [Algibacter lectus]